MGAIHKFKSLLQAMITIVVDILNFFFITIEIPFIKGYFFNVGFEQIKKNQTTSNIRFYWYSVTVSQRWRPPQPSRWVKKIYVLRHILLTNSLIICYEEAFQVVSWMTTSN